MSASQVAGALLRAERAVQTARDEFEGVQATNEKLRAVLTDVETERDMAQAEWTRLRAEHAELLQAHARLRREVDERQAVEPGAYPPSAVPNALRGVDLAALVRDAQAHKPLQIAGVRYVAASAAREAEAVAAEATAKYESLRRSLDEQEPAVLDSTQQEGLVLVNLSVPGRMVTISSVPVDDSEVIDVVQGEPPAGVIIIDSDNDHWARCGDGKWLCFDTVAEAQGYDGPGSHEWSAMQRWAPFRYAR